MAYDPKEPLWNANEPLDLDLLDEAFEDVNYLRNYDEQDFQSLTDIDLSLLLPDSPPDTPDNESQTSNPSDNGSDSGCYSNHGSPSSPGSSNSSTSGSVSEYIGSPSSVVVSSHHIPIVQPAMIYSQPTPQPPQQPIVFTNGYANYPTYQPYQAIPIITPAPTVGSYSPPSTHQPNMTKSSNFRPIACKPTTVQSSKSSHPTHKPHYPLISTNLPKSSSSSTSDLANEEAMRKAKLEERKKKNRIASTNSRNKQKDYLTKLETNVKELNKECDDLKIENKRLKSRVHELERMLGISDCSQDSVKDINGNFEFPSQFTKNSKAKLSMFAVLCFVCFQFSPFSNNLQPTITNSPGIINKNSTAIQEYQIRHGRHLLWAVNDSQTDNSLEKFEERFEKLQQKTYRNASVKCEDYYFNVTESIRLENELRDLLTRLKFEDVQREERRSRKAKVSRGATKRLLFDSKHVPIPRLKMWMQKQNHGSEFLDRDHEQFPPSENEFAIDYENLLGNVHRRDDTFYYLSYPSKGHMFLPPVSNRTDVRPRFSFLIPSFNNLTLDDAGNGTGEVSRNQLSNSSHTKMVLLQIDCQVINTKVTLIDIDSVKRQQSTSVKNVKNIKNVKNSGSNPVKNSTISKPDPRIHEFGVKKTNVKNLHDVKMETFSGDFGGNLGGNFTTNSTTV